MPRDPRKSVARCAGLAVDFWRIKTYPLDFPNRFGFWPIAVTLFWTSLHTGEDGSKEKVEERPETEQEAAAAPDAVRVSGAESDFLDPAEQGGWNEGEEEAAVEDDEVEDVW